MSKYSKLPKGAKKHGKHEVEHSEKRKHEERQENLDVIFTENYEESLQMVRRMIRTGK
jgi:hypothetical protein